MANQKGGVGKSTTAVSLGAALAELGHEVLVADLDPQGNASTGLGVRHLAREVTTYEVLLAEASVEDAIVETEVERLSAIPSTIDLAGAEIELVSQFSRELRLRRALDSVRGRFDFVLLDCPPSLGLLTVNALAAADELIVPIQCEYYALEGLGQLLRNVRLVQQNVNPRLRLSGIVLTMFDARTKLSEQVVEEVRKYFGPRVYDTIIPRTVRLSEAPGFGQPITVFDPASRGAKVYRSLAEEVANRVAEGALPALADLPSVIVPARAQEEPVAAPEDGPADEAAPEQQPEVAPPADDIPAEEFRAEEPEPLEEPVAPSDASAQPAVGRSEWPERNETPLRAVAPPQEKAEDRAETEEQPPAPADRPVRVVHIGDLESRDSATGLPVPSGQGHADDQAAPAEAQSRGEPRRRRKLFRKGGQQ